MMFIVVISAVGSDMWHITFTPHSLNTGVLLTTNCWSKDGKLSFRAVDFGQIDPGWNHADMHRQTTPKGDRCEVAAMVMRNVEGAFGDPDKDYIGESQSSGEPSEEEFP
jgi:hypothetical protein